jgi:hypothetical protein
MGHANVISHIDLRRRLKQAQQLANQIMFVRERVFCEVAPIAIASSPRPGAATMASGPLIGIFREVKRASRLPVDRLDRRDLDAKAGKPDISARIIGAQPDRGDA